MINSDDILTSPNVPEEALNDVNARIPYQFVVSLRRRFKNTTINSIELSHQRMQVHIFFDISSILLPQKQRYCDRRLRGVHNDVQALGNGPLTTLLPSSVRSRYNRKG